MNNHTEKLLGQALDQAVPKTWTQLSHEQVTKLSQVLAELIVRECAEIADTAEPFLASDLIKQHFGIEERKGWVCPKCGVDRTQDVCPKGHTAAVTGDCPMTATAQTQVKV